MFNRIMIQGSQVVAKVSWFLLLALLPITSMPLVVKLAGSDTVAAPSGVFLAVLLLVFLIPALWQGKSLPRQIVPLLFFGLAAVFSTALSYFNDLPGVHGLLPLRNELQSLITLGIGLSFYGVVSTYIRNERDLTLALRILNWSGLVILLWSAAQAAAWFSAHRYPEWMRDINDLISVGPLYRQRVTGFSLEPSWLAHQLNMLYLPLWLAMTAAGRTAHAFKIWKISLENVLLAGGFVALLLTSSRVGLLACLLMLGYLFLLFTLQAAGWISQKVIRRANGEPGEPERANNSARRRLAYFGILAAMVVVYAAGIFGVAFTLSKLDPKRWNIFQYTSQAENPVLQLANQLTFASRLVYWQAGWNIFNDHPLTGVGLGNAGFYFTEKLPPYAWSLVEVRELVFRSGSLLNIKSLWVRLLAETGILGFAFFVSFLYLMWMTARSLRVGAMSLAKPLSLMGQLVILSLLVEGFSIDSFALPYIWVSCGIVTSAYTLTREERSLT